MKKYICRAKRKDNNEWIYGYVCRYGHTGKEKWYIIPEYASALYSVEVIPETVGCFTGIKDENGAMIFEGDICEIEGYIGTIEFNERYGQLDFAGDEIIISFEKVREDKIVIKGNKQDNPNLLDIVS